MKSTLNELDLILKTIELYQDGHYHSDVEKLKQAFHPNAHIVGYYKGELAFTSRDEYLAMLMPEESSAKSEEPSYTKFLSLDKTDTTVVVKIESLMSGYQFISYLSMIKVDDSWQIINGLFHNQEEHKE